MRVAGRSRGDRCRRPHRELCRIKLSMRAMRSPAFHDRVGPLSEVRFAPQFRVRISTRAKSSKSRSPRRAVRHLRSREQRAVRREAGDTRRAQSAAHAERAQAAFVRSDERRVAARTRSVRPVACAEHVSHQRRIVEWATAALISSCAESSFPRTRGCCELRSCVCDGSECDQKVASKR
jgi:hypothetical protein